MFRRIGLKALKAFIGIVGIIWILAPVSSYDGLVVFGGASVVGLILILVLKIVDDQDADSGWWPKKRESKL